MSSSNQSPQEGFGVDEFLSKYKNLLKEPESIIPGAKGFLKEISEAVEEKISMPPKVRKGKRSGSRLVLPENARKPKRGGKVEYYWQFWDPAGSDYNPPLPIFTITPKWYFDQTGAISDQGYGSEDFPEGSIPEGFQEVQESDYEFNGTRQEAEAILRADPRFEEKQMLGPEGLLEDER